MSSAEKGFTPQPGDERLTTAILSDSCDAIGLRQQVFQQRLAPLVPGSRAFGRARTARFVPMLEFNPEDPYREAIEFIDELRNGEFVVLATDRNNDSAFWGELFSAAALGSGAVGVLTDGNLRDTSQIADLGFPAFSRSRRPIDFRGRMRLIAHDVSVNIAGVRIESGDLVMADDDGVVVVPSEHEDDVLALARERASRESNVLAELLAGASVAAVWERHRVL